MKLRRAVLGFFSGFFCAAGLAACLKAPDTADIPQSDLIADLSIKLSSGQYVDCGATFYKKSDPFTPVMLESDAVVTCNGIAMPYSGALFYYVGFVNQPGTSYQIKVVRPSHNTTMASGISTF